MNYYHVVFKLFTNNLTMENAKKKFIIYYKFLMNWCDECLLVDGELKIEPTPIRL